MAKHNTSSKDAQKWKLHKMKTAGINVEEVFSDDESLSEADLVYTPPNLPDYLKDQHLQAFVGITVYKEGTEIGKVSQTQSKYLLTENRMEINHEQIKDQRTEVCSSLPIYEFEEDLIKAIRKNQVLVVVGETGSGKSTVVPQFLYKAGFQRNGFIGCTQPRRTAAISLAKTVGKKLKHKVSYTIRFEDTTTKDTVIKYMTEGVLLRELKADPFLTKFSVILLDEAHERSMNLDICISLLRRVLEKRHNFRLIVMSATLQVSKICSFFNCPSFSIVGRSFDVELEYLRVNVDDYAEWIVRKVLYIHGNKEKGDIIVFVTGKEDVDGIVGILNYKMHLLELEQLQNKVRGQEDAGSNKSLENRTNHENRDNGDNRHSCNNKSSDYLKCQEGPVDEKLLPYRVKLRVFPFYSVLSEEKQQQVFREDATVRKCIVSTNIAETSLTIPNIKYVVDSGLQKVSVYNYAIGDTLITCPISQANADQRAGRAGRTSDGICYRMYTKDTYYNELLPSSIPEIQRSNIAGVVLTLLSIGVTDLDKVRMIDMPPKSVVTNSLILLRLLEAIDESGRITSLGLMMAELNIDPPLAKLIFSGVNYSCVYEMVVLSSILSFESVFTREFDKEDPIVDSSCDFITLLRVYHLFSRSQSRQKLCVNKKLNYRALDRASKLIALITQSLRRLNIKITKSSNRENIQKCLAHTFYYNIAKKCGKRYTCYNMLNKCRIHPSSVIFEGHCPLHVLFYKRVVTKDEYLYCCTGISANAMIDTGYFKTRIESYINRAKFKQELNFPTVKQEFEDRSMPNVVLDVPIESLYERYVKCSESEDEEMEVRKIKRTKFG